MKKKIYMMLSIGCLGAALWIFLDLVFGTADAIAGDITIYEVAQRWRLIPYFYIFLIAGIVFVVLYIKAAIAFRRQRQSAQRNYNMSGGTYHKNRSGSHKYRSAANNGFRNSGFENQTMDDMIRQQYQQFMNETDTQQQQQSADEMNEFMDEMNRQQQHFMDNMNQGNSFNMDNDFNNFL